ncbi:T9SS type A sorting domain-containing protein [Fluviicola sp.]|uniref:T9SS type A sorting domain-containing protein n=1 Tax=Fluviicola sp. TaxID=1917219 RepID=UPI0031E1F65A
MKTKLSMLCFLAVNLLYGQYDYFKWPKANTNLLGVAVSPKSGLAVDVFNRAYYIDNVSKKIRFMYGDVLSTAPIARSNSNLIYRNNPTAGDRFYYVTSTNKISSIWYNNSVSAWQVGTEFTGMTDNVAPLSFIEVVDEDHVYFIRDSDKKVCEYWHTASGSGFRLLNMFALPAAPYSNIVVKNNTLYYITNTNKPAYMKYNFTTSTWDAAVYLNTEVLATGSKIQVDGNTGQIFYVRASDNKLCSYWTIGSSSGFGPVNAIGISAMTGTDIRISSSGDQVIYIGTDGNFHNEYYDLCKWSHNRLNPVCNLTANYNSFAMDNNGALYFFDGTNICTLSKITPTANFVYRKGSRLAMNGQNYNAKLANYCMNIYNNNGVLFVGPNNQYDSNLSNWFCLTPSDCSPYLDQHFSELQQAGFNTIRLTGLHLYCNNTSSNPNVDPKIYIDAWDVSDTIHLPNSGTKIDINSGNKLQQMLDLYEMVINKAGEYGLKVNFFAGLEKGHKNYNTVCHSTYGVYLNTLANRFKNNPNVLMYSLLLEADSYDFTSEVITDKDYICSTVNGWYEQIRNVDKNHLVTMSNVGTFSLENWDPGILNIDVITYHIYPDLSLNYQNYNQQYYLKKLKWVSNIMNDKIQKPWIIGEIGIPGVSNPATVAPPSNNIVLVVDYATQRNFAISSLQNVFHSGASGYGWWQYRDVYTKSNGTPVDRGAYFGLVDNYGNKKPIIATGNSVFNITTLTNGCNSGTAPNDYYNELAPYNGYAYNVTGTVKDVNNQPVVNGTVRCNIPCGAPGEYREYSTFTKSDGSFKVYAECPVIEMNITGVGTYTKTINNPVSGTTYTLNPITCNSIYTKSMGQDQGGQSQSGSLLEESNNALTEEDLTIAPNPFTSKVKFSFGTEQTLTSIRITDLMGKEVKNCIFSGKELEINLEGSPKGIYMVQITNSENKTMTKRIIAQ